MANIKSSKKDIVRSRQNRVRNSSWKSRIKTEVRKSRTAIVAHDAGAAELVKTASRLLDKAVTKGVIHKGQAARRKSRLAKRLAGGMAKANETTRPRPHDRITVPEGFKVTILTDHL